MLFNSYVYILFFLPFVIAVYFLLGRYSKTNASLYWLIAASLFFYSFWNPIYLPLLLLSISFNYYVGLQLQTSETFKKKNLLAFGILINLFLLGYFKYADFFIENVNSIFGAQMSPLYVALPLAISFFTFQQIAYLVDCYRGEVKEYSFRDYVLFVSFFPQLIAGPIVHHVEMMPQFKALKNALVDYKNISVGLLLIAIGLFKKVVVADTFAEWASGGYDAGVALTFVEAWVTSLSYTLQLYFDFSGYTDMAIGAALLFNIRLPINFNSPYKAADIQDFWRRWHMTLSRFMREYLYIPLGGNRRGRIRTDINVFSVFLLGGLWHGAAWTFVAWGAIHGLGMIILGFWKRLGITLPRVAGVAITFLFVNVAWVFFRAESFNDAIRVLRGLVGLDGVSFPAATERFLAFLPYVQFEGAFAHSGLNGNEPTYTIFLWILGALGVVFFGKNSMQIIERFRPNICYLLLIIALFVLSLYSMNNVSEFIYFNF